MDSENLCNQIEEIEALSAIYGEDWCDFDCGNRIYSINIADSITDSKFSLQLQVRFCDEYPSNGPAGFQINAPWLRGAERQHVERLLDSVYADNIGEPIVYLTVEKIREYLQEKSEKVEINEAVAMSVMAQDMFESDQKDKSENQENADVLLENVTSTTLSSQIYHGETITDRKSVFQAHVAAVHSKLDTTLVINSLLENKKIANATHNITAWVFEAPGGVVHSECFDDGENQAGSRLLNLLKITNVMNVMVVVSRWYGGILLGPDRFKHILNAARSLLVDQNYIKETPKKGSHSKKR